MPSNVSGRWMEWDEDAGRRLWESSLGFQYKGSVQYVFL
jgi:hypothetical protein